MFNLLYLLIVLLFCACQGNGSEKSKTSADAAQPLKKFYYPVDSLEDGLVYEFVDDSTGNTINYYLFKTVKDEAGDKFLICTGYNAFFEQQFMSREWIVADGTIQKDYLIMQFDSASGKSLVRPAKIEEAVVFPFSPVKDSAMAYRFRIKFTLLPDTALLYDFIKDRRFDSFTTCSFEGKELKAAKIKINETREGADRTQDGGHWSVKQTSTEIYAEGIGLVSVEQKYENRSAVSRLKRRMSVEEFQKLLKPKNN